MSEADFSITNVLPQKATVPTSGGYNGPAWLQTGGLNFNAMAFLAQQIVAGKAFAGLVKVLAVHGGGVGGPATVDVQPMVNQIDGMGKQTPHGPIYGLPCYRYQGGGGVIIVDPVVGDTGDAVICHRDISIVKETRAISGPGSFRQNDWADGCYFGAFLGAAAATYVQVTPTDITAHAAATIVATAGTEISFMVGGFGIVITSSGTMIDGKMFLPHAHSDVQTGGGVSGPVV